MDDLKWQSLNRLLDLILDKGLESRESVRLVAQLVLELESEFRSTKTGKAYTQEITDFYNRNEEWQQ